MSDFEKLINANDLIEWIMETYPDWCVGAIRSIVDHVEGMPSAEPEDKCSECDAWNKYKNYSSAEPEFATDTISRQTAIDAFYKYPNIHWTTLDILAKIKALPFVEPNLIKENEELKHRLQFMKEDKAKMKEDKAKMQGEINGLRFAIRCNGASMSEGEEE